MQDNKSSYSYDATGQSAKGFQCDEVVQSTKGMSLLLSRETLLPSLNDTASGQEFRA